MTTTSPTETILVVDDEPPIRHFVRQVLESEGYQLLVACNGDEALEIAECHPAPIDLLLTDIVMPRMDGFMLRDRLAASRPGIRSLFLSGYADHSVAVRGGLQESHEAFLPKPFTPDLLLRSIRRRLSSAPHPLASPSPQDADSPVA